MNRLTYLICQTCIRTERRCSRCHPCWTWLVLKNRRTQSDQTCRTICHIHTHSKQKDDVRPLWPACHLKYYDNSNTNNTVSIHVSGLERAQDMVFRISVLAQLTWPTEAPDLKREGYMQPVPDFRIPVCVRYFTVHVKLNPHKTFRKQYINH